MSRPALLGLILGLALGPGCRKAAPKTLGEIAADLDYGGTPMLPAPEGSSYIAAKGTPRDPVIGPLVADRHYDEILSAAAAGVALDMAKQERQLSRWTLREAAWRAGYPYPITDARAWLTVESAPPPPALVAWLEALPEDAPMGLVRARGPGGDAWVALRAAPAIDLGPLPRHASLGTPLRLPTHDGATYRVSDGAGGLITGTLDEGADILLASAGEWLVQILEGRRELARFPIYVDIYPPQEHLLAVEGETPIIGTARDADAFARSLLEQVRVAYDLPAWSADPGLDAAARQLDTSLERGAAQVFSALGLTGGAVEPVVWACDDVTVQNCLDRWVWDPRRREALLSESLDTFGLHTRLDGQGVHLTMVLADTDGV